MLALHQAVGTLVILAAIAALFWDRARRYVLYVLLLQVVLGVVVWVTGHEAPPVGHWVLAILAGGLYALANALERRGRPAGTIRVLLLVALLVVAFVFYLGQMAHRGSMA